MHIFSVWLRTGSNPPDINRFQSDTGKQYFCITLDQPVGTIWRLSDGTEGDKINWADSEPTADKHCAIMDNTQHG